MQSPLDRWELLVPGPFHKSERAAQRALEDATTHGGVTRATQQLSDGTWSAVVVLTATERCWAEHYRGRGVHVLAPRVTP